MLPRADGQEMKADGPLPEGAQYLPVGEGREIILKACVQCHDLKNTVSQRKSEEGWRRTVNEMIWRGTPLVGDEAETVIKYLSRSLGPDKAEPGLVKKIFAGGRGESKRDGGSDSGAALVNINAATAEELMTLPGVGALEARAIVEYREKHGAFKSADDLERVGAIAPAVRRNLEGLITVGRARGAGAGDAPGENKQ
jgi:competence protein ComEA